MYSHMPGGDLYILKTQWGRSAEVFFRTTSNLNFFLHPALLSSLPSWGVDPGITS